MNNLDKENRLINSNTTLVKVKLNIFILQHYRISSIQIQHLLKLNIMEKLKHGQN